MKRQKIIGLKTIGVAMLLGSLVTLTVKAEEYKYDDLNRVIQVTYEDGSYVSYQYDGSGNMTENRTYKNNKKNEDNSQGNDDGKGNSHVNNGDTGNTVKPGNADKNQTGQAGNTNVEKDNPPIDGDSNKKENTIKPKQTKIKVKSGKAKYTIIKPSGKKGYAILTGLNSKKRTSYTMPSSIRYKGKKYPVREIGKRALYKYKKLKKVVIGSNVERIGEKAFYGDKSLKTITVKTKKLKTVGKKALYGIHKKAVIKVPKSKLTKYKKVFKKKGQKKTVKIKK